MVSRQAVEGHHGRMREAMWVAFWSDIISFFCYTFAHAFARGAPNVYDLLCTLL